MAKETECSPTTTLQSPTVSTENKTASTTTTTTTENKTSTTTSSTTTLPSGTSTAEKAAPIRTAAKPLSSSGTSFYTPIDYKEEKPGRPIFSGKWLTYLEEKNFEKYDDEQDPIRAVRFIQTPVFLEPGIMQGVMLCLDSFLFVLTILPIRIAIALYNLVLYIFNRPKNRQYHSIFVTDLLQGVIFVSSFLVLYSVDITSIIQAVKEQSLLKLKIMVTILELMNRLFSTITKDIIGSLFWYTTTQPFVGSSENVYCWLLAQGLCIMHSLLLVTHISVLDVAMNNEDSSLLTLLILVQFGELKASVMKEFKRDKLLETYRLDIIERFQTCLFVIVLLMTNLTHNSSYYIHSETSWLISVILNVSTIYIAEVAVDHVKHLAISAVNHVPPVIYLEFNKVFGQEFITCQNLSWLTDYSRVVTQKFGLSRIPLACLALKSTMDSYFHMQTLYPSALLPLYLVVLYLVLLASKFFVMKMCIKICDRVERAQFEPTNWCVEKTEPTTAEPAISAPTTDKNKVE